MLAFLNEREEDYKVEKFIMELCEASKYLGALEAKINSYHFEKILIPLFSKCFVSFDSFASEPEIVNPSSRRISARPLMLIPPIPMK